MRVSKEQAAENRARILSEASRLFREKGLAGVGVDKLTEAAGLTHGSLYSQFGSKERLTAAALEHALARGALSRLADTGLPPREALSATIERYLSPAHRDAPGQGCALAALACEIPRQGDAVREVFTEGLRGKIDRLAGLIGDGDEVAGREGALAMVSSLVGALVLARAVDDPSLSDDLLTAATKMLKQTVKAG